MAPKTFNNEEMLEAVERLWQVVKASRDALHGTILVMRDTLDLRDRLGPQDRVAAAGIQLDEVLGVLTVEFAIEASAYTNSFEKADQAALEMGPEVPQFVSDSGEREVTAEYEIPAIDPKKLKA